MASSKQLRFGSEEKSATEHVEYVDPKSDVESADKVENGSSIGDEKKQKKPPSSARDLVSEVLILEDDPSLNPWTFRMWFIGISLSLFAAYGSSSPHIESLNSQWLQVYYND
jgi:hypothetical protein